ncbi:MAG: acyltransferase, partial [Planctomycetaceae bacterium]|nr:acyltransferase [Planctomycetaceae bacterium]
VFALSVVSPFSQVQGELVTHFTYTFNIRVALLGWPDSSLLNHFWSLCIEEQFYLVWPFLAFGCSPRTLKRILIGAIVCSLCLRLSILQVWHSWEAEYTFPLCRLDGLAFGALLALENASEQRDFRLLKRLGMVSIVISVLLFVLFRGFRLENAELMAVLPTLIAAAYLPLFCNVLTVEDSPLKTMLRSRWLAWLGTLSYGLYVYHQIIRVLVQEYWGIRETILGTLVIGGSSLILSLISFQFVETYFLNLKTKFAPHEPIGPVSNQPETVSSN